MSKLKLTLTVSLAAIALFMITNINTAQEASQYQYVGNKKCKTCHSSDKKGAQYKSWEASKHAKAYEVLASEEAKKIAQAKGIADPQKDAQCLKCHVTGYGVDAKLLGEGYKMEEGVGCESCHGAGGDYKGVMKDSAKSKENGLIEPNEDACKKCHNDKSPTFKEFKFDEMVKKIAHPNPANKK